MRWCRTDPVQEVDALIVIGPDAPERVTTTLSRKSGLFASLTIEQGEGWVAIFAAALDGGTETLLPRLPDATALYAMVPGWWLPVGIRLAVPDHAQAELIAAMCDRFGMTSPAIIVPRFGRPDSDIEDCTDHADIYLIRHPRPVGAPTSGRDLPGSDH